MITNVSITSIFVKDIEASKAFYTDVLGFVEHTDITLGDGSYLWCSVKHPSQPELEITLSLPGPPYSPDMVAAINRALDEGGMFAIGVTVDDCQKTYQDLLSKGVEFINPPDERPYGVEAIARDNSGNWIVMVERREFTAADFD